MNTVETVCAVEWKKKLSLETLYQYESSDSSIYSDFSSFEQSKTFQQRFVNSSSWFVYSKHRK